MRVSNLRIFFVFQLRNFKSWLFGPENFRDFRETGPISAKITLVQRFESKIILVFQLRTVKVGFSDPKAFWGFQVVDITLWRVRAWRVSENERVRFLISFNE